MLACQPGLWSWSRRILGGVGVGFLASAGVGVGKKDPTPTPSFFLTLRDRVRHMTGDEGKKYNNYTGPPLEESESELESESDPLD